MRTNIVTIVLGNIVLVFWNDFNAAATLGGPKVAPRWPQGSLPPLSLCLSSTVIILTISVTSYLLHITIVVGCLVQYMCYFIYVASRYNLPKVLDVCVVIQIFFYRPYVSSVCLQNLFITFILILSMIVILYLYKYLFSDCVSSIVYSVYVFQLNHVVLLEAIKHQINLSARLVSVYFFLCTVLYPGNKSSTSVEIISTKFVQIFEKIKLVQNV